MDSAVTSTSYGPATSELTEASVLHGPSEHEIGLFSENDEQDRLVLRPEYRKLACDRCGKLDEARAGGNRRTVEGRHHQA